jgi:WD40 repeat protein/energy-coupling factor transporter ATP-binding protein EcfA2
LLNLDELTKLRNPLVHNGKQATPVQAQLLYYGLQSLIESFGIESLEQGSELNIETLPHLVKLDNPYRGLESFRQAHAQQFFGRDKEIEALKAWVMQRSFVAVIGNSGSGKSSLVFAGLIPKLNDWLIIECRPQDRAVYQLAAALIDGLYQTEMNQVARFSEIRTLTTELAKDATLIQDVLVRIRTQHAQSKRFLVAIDQFEELYTLNSPTEQHQFIALLLQMVQSSQPLCVLITLRADFLTAVLNHNEFAKLFDTDRHKLLGNLGNDELLAAITQPLTAQGLRFEEGLPQRIVRELGDTSGQLPLLQFTLQQLWEQRTGELLSHLSYENLGGVNLALARYADAIYQGFSEEGQLEIRRLFIQLVQPGEGTEDTRKVAELSQFDKAAQQAVIRRLADARLLVTSENSVEIAHDALIHHWQRTRDWMQEERPFRASRNTLRVGISIFLFMVALTFAGGYLWQIREKNAVNAKINQTHNLLHFSEVALANGYTETSVRLTLEGLPNFSESYPDRPLVSKAYDTLLKIITSQNNTTVRDAIFSPDNTSVFVRTSEYGYLWDIKTKQLIASLEVSDMGQILWAQFSPDTKNIVTSNSDSNAYVWDSRTGLKRFTLEHGYGSFIRIAEFSSDGKKIITAASSENNSYIWDANTGEKILSLAGGSIARFNSASTLVITGDNYVGEAYVWNIETGEKILTLSGHPYRVRSVRFSPDDRKIITISDTSIHLWNSTGKLIAVLEKHFDHVNSAYFSSDSSKIVTSGGNNVFVWDSETGKLLLTLDGHTKTVNTAHFSNDDKRIVTGSNDGIVRIFDSNSGKLIHLLRGHSSIVNSVRFSFNGLYLISASADATALLWDANTGEQVNVFHGRLKILHERGGAVKSATFSPDGQYIVTTLWDGTARILESTTGKPLAFLHGHEKTINSATFSPDGRYIITSSDDNTARIWETSTGKSLLVLQEHKKSVKSASFSFDGRFVVTASEDNTARVWDVDTGNVLTVLSGHRSYVTSATFNSDGNLIVTSSDDGTARLWDAHTGNLLRVMLGHQSYVNLAIFSPDSQYVLTASDDNTARLWNISAENLPSMLQEHIVLDYHVDVIRSAMFSSDGQNIVTASHDGTCHLWNAHTGDLLDIFHVKSIVNSAKFSPDGRHIVTASNEGNVHLWDAGTGDLLTVLQGHRDVVNSAEFSPDGRHIVTASRDGTARIWLTFPTLEEMITYAQKMLPPRISDDPRDANIPN